MEIEDLLDVYVRNVRAMVFIEMRFVHFNSVLSDMPYHEAGLGNSKCTGGLE